MVNDAIQFLQEENETGVFLVFFRRLIIILIFWLWIGARFKCGEEESKLGKATDCGITR